VRLPSTSAQRTRGYRLLLDLMNSEATLTSMMKIDGAMAPSASLELFDIHELTSQDRRGAGAIGLPAVVSRHRRTWFQRVRRGIEHEGRSEAKKASVIGDACGGLSGTPTSSH
jgi:hypothetical protein